MRTKTKGFTLVELLVVISIIALLLSILMPSLSKARQLARRIQCASNFHQIGTIYQAYSADYRTWIPRFASSIDDRFGVDPGIGNAIGSVYPYHIDAKLFDYLKKSYGTKAIFWVCPSLLSNGGKRGFLSLANFGNDQLPQHDTSPYPYVLGIARLNGLINMSKANPTTVKDSSTKPEDNGTKILAADLNIKWKGDWSDPFTVISHIGKNSEGYILPAGGNILKADGSVTWIKSNIMGQNNTPVTASSPGKFSHWSGGGSRGEGRDYYW